MQVTHFIGIDVSKDKLDISLALGGQIKVHVTVVNRQKEIHRAMTHLMKEHGATVENTVFCMEYTGIYNLPLIRCLTQMQAVIWMESGVQIRRSLGMVRGKNDQVDSQRIALYAYTHQHQIKRWKAPRALIEKIAALLSQRALMVKTKKQLATALGEQMLFLDKEVCHRLNSHGMKAVQVIEKQIKLIEAEIRKLMASDEKLNRLYQVITSIPGIGFVTAAYVITTTNEFVSFTNPKKYACYCGVVPFEHTSGTSVRGKTRVSHLANKNMKTLLHLAALGAIKSPGELREYYVRKVEEGKNKMSVLNAIRNKLVLRIFSCVSQNRLYEKNFTLDLVLS
jgi:transposase